MFLNWSISLVTTSGLDSDGQIIIHYWRLLQSIGPIHQQMHEVMVDSTTFHFSRSSAEDSLPVVSKLLIRPAPNISLNGTMVNCTDVTSSETASTIAIIINVSDVVYCEFMGPMF